MNIKQMTNEEIKQLVSNLTNKSAEQYIDCSNGNEWGVDIVKINNGQFEARLTNPMVDDDYTEMDTEGVVALIEEQIYSWKEYNKEIETQAEWPL